MNNLLTESMSQEFMESLLESKNYGYISDITKNDIRLLMENTREQTEKDLNEATLKVVKNGENQYFDFLLY